VAALLGGGLDGAGTSLEPYYVKPGVYYAYGGEVSYRFAGPYTLAGTFSRASRAPDVSPVAWRAAVDLTRYRADEEDTISFGGRFTQYTGVSEAQLVVGFSIQ
jgi:hypothetical protein